MTIEFTDDEIACLKKMIYKFRQNEILELYNKRVEPPPKRLIKEDIQIKSFLVKVKEFFNGMGTAR